MRLVELNDILDYWLVPKFKVIHIIVEIPRGKCCVYRVIEISLTIYTLLKSLP